MRGITMRGVAVLWVTLLFLVQQQGATSQDSPRKLGKSTIAEVGGYEQLTVPAGTRVPLSLLIGIRTKEVHRGDVVHFETRYPVYVQEQLAIPAGVYVEGVIEKIGKLDSAPRTGGLQIRLTRLIFSTQYEVRLDGAALSAREQNHGVFVSAAFHPGVGGSGAMP